MKELRIVSYRSLAGTISVTIALIFTLIAISIQSYLKWYVVVLAVALQICIMVIFEILRRREKREKLFAYNSVALAILRLAKQTVEKEIHSPVSVTLFALAGKESLNVAISINEDGNVQQVRRYYIPIAFSVARRAIRNHEVNISIGEDDVGKATIALPIYNYNYRNHEEVVVGVLNIDTKTDLSGINPRVIDLLENYTVALSPLASEVHRLES